jgi:alkanesulfonate monooxygenase SsuD/methylene tetrahydromethanopterin reductase-like flavin-dependent oxidoreductase (luciferase family)
VIRLAVELSGRAEPGPSAVLDARYWTGLVRLAEAGDLDFVVFTDSFVPPSDAPGEPGRLDAVAVAARVAPLTESVGLVPVATTTHTEPFHLSKAIATLDLVSMGRAGWQPEVSRTEAEAALFGRKPAAPADELWREAGEAIEVVVRLWDSWEDDAVIRDAATGRYIDRDRLHYIDFVGEFFSVKGPSITPRSPQAHPPVVLRADQPEAAGVVRRWADVARVARIEQAEAVHGAAVLLDVPVATGDTAAEVVERVCASAAAGLAGVTLIPEALPGGLRLVTEEVVPLLVERGLRAAGPVPAGATLRDRFGLPRPANHFVAAT